MRPSGNPAQLERRRRAAVQLVEEGETLSAAARQVHASVSSVFRWWEAYQRTGPRGLASKSTPGRPPELSPREKQRLVRGPLRAGYTTDLWTLPRVAKLIQQEFGIGYHPGRVWRVLRALGWRAVKSPNVAPSSGMRPRLCAGSTQNGHG
jgi:transposase